jgi:hypothetical protein
VDNTARALRRKPPRRSGENFTATKNLLHTPCGRLKEKFVDNLAQRLRHNAPQRIGEEFTTRF